MPYGDVETLLAGWLATALDEPGVTITVGAGDLPADLTHVVPYIHVTAIGGADDVVSLDRPTVDIDVYASNRAAAKGIAERARYAMRLLLPGHTAAGMTASRVGTVLRPTVRDWQSNTVHLVAATYQLTLHCRISA